MVDRRGFTLIEVLAALALLNLSGENTRSGARVETRTLAGVVAENVGIEAVIAPALSDGETRGETALAGRTWRWNRVVSGTDDPGLQRIEVRVSTDEGQVSDRTLFRTRA